MPKDDLPNLSNVSNVNRFTTANHSDHSHTTPHATSAALSLPSFDEMMKMAQDDPESLTRLRQEMAQATIANASQEMQPRLLAQQSHIDRLISSGKNPNHTNVLLMKELRQQVDKFCQALQGTPPCQEEAKVLSLARYTESHPKDTPSSH